MKARWLGAAALIAAAAAGAAWLVFGPGLGTAREGALDALDDMADSDRGADGAARPGLAAAKPGSAGEERSRTGRCEIVGVVRREGKPVAAGIEARLVRSEKEDARAIPAVAAVLLASPSRRWPVVARSTAGTDGRFRLQGLAKGAYQVVATADDGAKGAAQVELEAEGAYGEANPHIRAGKESLAGRVVHADGRPWHGAVRVTEGSRDDGFPDLNPVDDPTPTDAEGRFQVLGLAAGPVRVSAIEESVLRVTDDSVRLPFAGDYVLVIDANAAELSGRVVDAADGSPVAGARVAVSGGDSGSLGFYRAAATDVAGRFRAAVLAGKGTVSAEADGYVERSAEYTDPKDEIELRLTKSASVKGRVTSASDGRPVEGVTVRCEPIRGGYFRADDSAGVQTDAEGRYAIPMAPPGEVAVVALGAGWIASGFLAKDAGSKNPFAVTLVAGKESVVDLTVVPGAKLSGIVFDFHGEPVPGARVEGSAGGISAFFVLARRDFTPATYAQKASPTASAADGTFALDSLLPGTEYRLEATAPGAASGRAGPVTASVEAPPRVEIRLPAPRWVEVTILDERDGTPIAGASASVRPRPKKEPGEVDRFAGRFDGFGWIRDIQETTDARGIARAGPLPEGPLDVTASAVGFMAPDDAHPLEGSEGPASELSATIRLGRGLEISGHVLMPDGKPAVGATVRGSGGRRESARRQFRSRSESVEADASGAFRLSGLAEGTIDISATLSRNGEYRATASVDAGRSGVTLPLIAAVSQDIVLRVLDGNGKPVHEGDARFEANGNSSHSRVSEGRAVIRVQRPDDAPEGVVVVSDAQDADGKPAPWGEGRLEGVKPGGTYEIRLPPEVAISGRVVGPDGRGVEGASLAASPASEDGGFWSMRHRLRGGFGGDDDATRTDADGAFRLGRLGAGDHLISVDPPATYIEPDPVRAAAGSSNVRIVLRAGVVASITVLDAAGAPVPGAFVTTTAIGDGAGGAGDDDDRWPSSMPDELIEAFTGGPPATGKDGVTRVPSLDPAARYILKVRGPKSRPDLARFSRKDWTPADTTVRLETGFAVAGFVRDAAGRPIAEADVTAKASDGRESDVETGEDGGFRFSRLPAGSVELSARLSGSLSDGGAKAAASVAAGASGVVLTVDTGLDLVVHIDEWKGDESYQTAHLSEEGEARRGR